MSMTMTTTQTLPNNGHSKLPQKGSEEVVNIDMSTIADVAGDLVMLVGGSVAWGMELGVKGVRALASTVGRIMPGSQPESSGPENKSLSARSIDHASVTSKLSDPELKSAEEKKTLDSVDTSVTTDTIVTSETTDNTDVPVTVSTDDSSGTDSVDTPVTTPREEAPVKVEKKKTSAPKKSKIPVRRRPNQRQMPSTGIGFNAAIKGEYFIPSDVPAAEAKLCFQEHLRDLTYTDPNDKLNKQSGPLTEKQKAQEEKLNTRWEEFNERQKKFQEKKDKARTPRQETKVSKKKARDAKNPDGSVYKSSVENLSKPIDRKEMDYTAAEFSSEIFTKKFLRQDVKLRRRPQASDK